MRVFVLFATAAALGLSIMSPPARAGGTSLVVTYSGQFDLPIPDDPGATRGWMRDAVVMVPDHLIICDLDVSLNIRHTAAFDLWLFLKSPGGKVVLLSKSDPTTGFYEGEDYAATIFDDEADIRIEDGKPPFAGRYRPTRPLAAFDGADACGLWSLRVFDAYYADTGYLDFFSLTVTASVQKPVAAVPAPAAGGLALLGLVLLGPRRNTSFGIRNRSPRRVRHVSRPSDGSVAPRASQPRAASFSRTFFSCVVLN